jgi:ABC-type nitrate/sulfonate/bicarbonate transport system substrate-binding protein
MSERIVAAFVPLVDCAVLVAARHQGFAAAEGIDLELVKEPSWARLRDHLCLGHVDCAHALAPLPVALTLGVGHVQVECVAPFVLGRGGNAVTVSNRLFAEMQAQCGDTGLTNPLEAGRALASAVRRRAAPLTLGMVFPFSNHNFDLRYWLAASGVHPDRDVRLVAIPPPLMVDSLRAGIVDGFCVGAPWNSLAVAQGLGSIVVTQSQLFPRAVEKVLALRSVFARNTERASKLLRALDSAAAWADEPANHSELAALLARPEYLDLPREIIAATIAGRLRFGASGDLQDPDYVYFHRHDANAPREADGLWAYAQMVRWGQLAPSDRAERAAASVFSAALYRTSVRGAGVETSAPLPFDRVAFSAANVRAYLRQFDVQTPFAEAHSGSAS